MSRPEKPIDWKKVDQLLMAGCTGTEIAPHFDMHYNTFYNKVQEKYNIGFSEYSASKKDQGDSLLKAKQFEKALSGKNDTMLIWLGKTRLKQSETKSTEELNAIEQGARAAVLQISRQGLDTTLSKSPMEITEPLPHQGCAGQQDQVQPQLGAEDSQCRPSSMQDNPQS